MRRAIKSVVDRNVSGGGTKYDDSMMSRGSSGCVPVMVKYGDTPIRRRTVTCSAQNTVLSALDHFD